MNLLTLTHWISQNTTVGKVKNFLNPYMSSIQSLYTYRIVAWAASQAWLGMGGQRFGVRGVTGLIPGGNTPFWGVSFKWDTLQREDSEREDCEKVLGLTMRITYLLYGWNEHSINKRRHKKKMKYIMIGLTKEHFMISKK